MSIGVIIAFALVMVVVIILKRILKFGIKVLLIIGMVSALVYFIMADIIPFITDAIMDILS